MQDTAKAGLANLSGPERNATREVRTLEPRASKGAFVQDHSAKIRIADANFIQISTCQINHSVNQGPHVSALRARPANDRTLAIDLVTLPRPQGILACLTSHKPTVLTPRNLPLS